VGGYFLFWGVGGVSDSVLELKETCRLWGLEACIVVIAGRDARKAVVLEIQKRFSKTPSAAILRHMLILMLAVMLKLVKVDASIRLY
jgi:hypothetical protein